MNRTQLQKVTFRQEETCLNTLGKMGPPMFTKSPIYYIQHYLTVEKGPTKRKRSSCIVKAKLDAHSISVLESMQ
jgi:hypothetical protein